MNLSREHLITLAVVAAAITVLVAAARLYPGRWTIGFARVLAVVILVNEASWWVWLAEQHALSITYSLPLQLCDVAAVITACALWFRTPLLVELTYFWGVAGTANGLITPDVGGAHFPSYPYVQYFVQHGAIVGAALFLVVGLMIAPRPWAVVRVYGLTLCLLVVDAVANLLTDGNYMYLRQTPGVRSVLNLMGPWPWYIAGGAVLSAILFLVLDLPFRISARGHARSKSAQYPPPA